MDIKIARISRKKETKSNLHKNCKEFGVID